MRQRAKGTKSGFPKNRDTFIGVSMIRIIVFWGLSPYLKEITNSPLKSYFPEAGMEQPEVLKSYNASTIKEKLTLTDDDGGVVGSEANNLAA